jgi:sulfatase maturation enzyme AslB (radical SAM superfamily)
MTSSADKGPFLSNRRAGQQPRLIVVVRVCTQCSLGCRYCGFSREVRSSWASIDRNHLRILGQSLQKHMRDSNRDVLVSWLGGEPYQWEDWRDLTKWFVETLGIPVSVTTNGLALQNDFVRRDSLQLFSEITISVDGLTSFHDDIRQSHGLADRIKYVVGSLRSERIGRRPRLRVNCVLTRHNLADFREFCHTMGNWGFDELTFNALGGNDRPEFFPSNGLRREDMECLVALLPDLRAELPDLKIRGSEAYMQRLVATSQDTPIAIEDCGPGEQFLFVDEQGRMGPCSFTAHQLGLHVSDLMHCDIDSIAQILKQRISVVAPASCLDCHATHVFEKFA